MMWIVVSVFFAVVAGALGALLYAKTRRTRSISGEIDTEVEERTSDFIARAVEQQRIKTDEEISIEVDNRFGGEGNASR